MLFRNAKVLPTDAHKGINAWLIYLALPAVSFKYLPHVQWAKDLLLPAIAPVIAWAGSWVWIRFYSSKANLTKASQGGLRIAAGLSNTSFIGFPLIMAYFGEKELSIAIICDQVTFTLLSTAGVIVAINSSGNHSLSANTIAQKLLKFPPFVGCILALTLPRFVDISFLDPLFSSLAATVAPLALFSIGLQLRFSGWLGEWKHISAALLYKLILAPALVLLFALVLNIKGTIAQISIFEAAMPTLLTAGIVTEEYSLNPVLVNLIVGIGIIVAFATTGLWFLVINNL
jgi:predicted permease